MIDSVLTKTDIEKKITAISSEIDRVTALDESYTLSDGQGSTTVRRRRLVDLRRELEYWEGRLDRITQRGGAVSVRVGRHGTV